MFAYIIINCPKHNVSFVGGTAGVSRNCTLKATTGKFGNDQNHAQTTAEMFRFGFVAFSPYTRTKTLFLVICFAFNFCDHFLNLNLNLKPKLHIV